MTDFRMAYSEQEHLRFQESSNVDDRTEHEIYVHPFMRAVQAGVASVMCSYSECSCPGMGLCEADDGTDQINASWACENERTLNQILKGENGFQGYIMSDWGAHHSTLAAVGGLDVRTIPLYASVPALTYCIRGVDVHAG